MFDNPWDPALLHFRMDEVHPRGTTRSHDRRLDDSARLTERAEGSDDLCRQDASDEVGAEDNAQHGEENHEENRFQTHGETREEMLPSFSILILPMKITLIKQDGKARRGEVTTPHGKIQTPFFMTIATVGAIKGLQTDEFKDMGGEILLANTYHLHLRPSSELVRDAGGLHKFMNWDGPILTDSGGFQVFSLAKIRNITEEGVTFNSHIDGKEVTLTPESSMQIQLNLGADIIMAFDECKAPDNKYIVKESLEMTTRWAQRSKSFFSIPSVAEESLSQLKSDSSTPSRLQDSGRNGKQEEVGVERKRIPKNYQKVVVGILIQDKRVLVSRRKADQSYSGLLEFPGGKVEIGEDERRAMQREFREEVGVEVSVRPAFEKIIQHEKKQVLYFHRCRILTGKPRSLEGQEVEWIDQQELNPKEFLPANKGIIDQLKKSRLD